MVFDFDSKDCGQVFLVKYFACQINYPYEDLQVSNLPYFNHYVELPWDEPTKTNREYLDWLNNKVNRTPWIKMDSQSLGMHGSVVFWIICMMQGNIMCMQSVPVL